MRATSYRSREFAGRVGPRYQRTFGVDDVDDLPEALLRRCGVGEPRLEPLCALRTEAIQADCRGTQLVPQGCRLPGELRMILNGTKGVDELLVIDGRAILGEPLDCSACGCGECDSQG